MLIDTHAHLNFPQFADTTIEDILARAKAAGVGQVINVGSDLEASEGSVALAKKYPEIYASVGIHPHDAAIFAEHELQRLEQLTRQPKVVAIGEIGLDYFKYDGARNVQKDAFRKQLALAKKLGLPVIIHDRDAHDDILTILSEEKLEKGVVHCFSGDMDFAKKVLDLGFLISFTGNITFPKAQGLRDIVGAVPLDRLMVETDSPFLAPQQYRGKRNEPAYVRNVAEKIAEIKGLSLEEIAAATTKTAINFFGL